MSHADLFKEVMDVTISSDFKFGDPSIEFLPLHLQSSISKVLYAGFQSIFSTVAEFLETTDLPLTVEAISAHLGGRAGVEFYLKMGGQIEHIFNMITHAARKDLILEDRRFEDTYYGGEGAQELYKKLPMFSNNLEFNLVRQMIVLNPTIRWGPYRRVDFTSKALLTAQEFELWHRIWQD
ncbi:hypothetical protein H0H81_003152 [Sphagnurus paluster]|uniref:Uncharacterized protein n=1 Tax=Sphagnurus paluster TaxID=117069 RepID=A0A9P7FRN9_9AGAR|nr:hypothetical protein H0H81_003152 [Sphagnurus paluster]